MKDWLLFTATVTYSLLYIRLNGAYRYFLICNLDSYFGFYFIQQNHHAVENTDRMEEFADVDFVGIEYLDPSELWEPYTANIKDPNHILPNNNGYWVLSLLTEDHKIMVNVAHLLINRDYWLFPHLKERDSSAFEKLLEMPVCDEEMIKRKTELVSQNLFDRDMSFALQLYSLGSDNVEIIVQGAELLST